MRKPLLESLQKSRGGTAFTANVPAPVGGWNTRDALAEMPTSDAPLLDNWIPRAGQLEARGGSEVWASGMTGAVKTIFAYTPPSGTNKLFACTDAGIYDVTSQGAVGAVKIALTNGYVNSVLLVNSAGSAYWWGCNGTDSVKLFDGTSWSSITGAITGVTSSTLIFPWLFKHRIFAIQKNTLDAWFLPLDSIQGAASRLPLGNLFRRGGYLVSGTSWTLDAGDGADDLCVFITSEGEVAVYKGIDPTSASNWALVGVYYVGRPLGRRCFVRLGGDVGVLVESGFFPLSKLLQTGSINFASALSNKIQPTFTAATGAVGVVAEGWEGCVYPRYDVVLLNIPFSGGALQYVMNTITGAWSSFSGWGAKCFANFENELYWGSATAGTLYKAWNGTLVADLGADIVTTAHLAWDYFGSRTMLKTVNLFRPLLAYDGTVETRWGISPDYTSIPLSSVMNRNAFSTGAVWDTAPWDTSSWGQDVKRYKLWRAANHYPGYALALWLQTASNNSSIAWSGTDYIIGRGGAI